MSKIKERAFAMNTPRENLLRTLRCQGFDGVPIDPNDFCGSQEEGFKQRFGHPDYHAWFKAPYRNVSLNLQARYEDPQALYSREQLPAAVTFDAWGLAHSSQPGCWHMTRMHHPLSGDATLDDIKRYPFPELAPTVDVELKSSVQAIQEQGLAARGRMACTVWERAWYLRSMEDLMADMMMDDERATVLIQRVTANSVSRIQAYARAGADIVEIGDDIGLQHSIMMSLDLWRKWLKPRLAQVIAAGKAIKPDLLIYYHSCGYVEPFLEDFIEIGIDILNPVQPECMEFAKVHALSKGRLAYWGTIGTQTTLPFGSVADVKDAVRSRLRTCGSAGGIVIGPTHMVEPEVPWENLVAMAEAAAEFKL